MERNRLFQVVLSLKFDQRVEGYTHSRKSRRKASSKRVRTLLAPANELESASHVYQTGFDSKRIETVRPDRLAAYGGSRFLRKTNDSSLMTVTEEKVLRLLTLPARLLA